MVHPYSFSFSLMVVDKFVDSHARGWVALQNVLDGFYLEDVVELFQKDQFKWNVFKKLVKHIDRVNRRNYLTYDKAKELWKYFAQVQKPPIGHKPSLTFPVSLLLF